MVGPNLRQRIGHGFVSRQVLAESAMIEARSTPTPLTNQAATVRKGFLPLTAKSSAVKAIDDNISGGKGAGFFDFMFPRLKNKPLKATDEDLDRLAKAMKDAEDASDDNLTIPAGFTYLGQFIDHDITLDLTPLSEAQSDPEMTKNFRTPGLDLDSVYGAGPGPFRFLFARQPDADGNMVDTPKLLIGTAESSRGIDSETIPELPNDLPRNLQGVALIGDHRNDENLLVAQIHLAFLKFHNAVVDHLAKDNVAPDMLFSEASKTVRWHYQWMVLHDFVERLVEPGLIEKTLKNGRKFYRFKAKPFMPWEFSGAAYRLGHSMVRAKYNHNRVFRTPDPHRAEGTFNLFFRFTNLSGTLKSGIPGQGTFPSNWVVDWRRYFDLPAPQAIKDEFNHSRKLDPFLAGILHTLPGADATKPVASLAFRNLKRGVRIGLPSGQDIAKAMLKEDKFSPITPEDIATGPDGEEAKKLGFDKQTPLWYYILKEAQIRGKGERLGPVGSRIVAEVFIGIIQGDENSFMAQKNWKPTLPAAKAGDFTMVDLLTFMAAAQPDAAKAINPVGD